MAKTEGPFMHQKLVKNMVEEVVLFFMQLRERKL